MTENFFSSRAEIKPKIYAYSRYGEDFKGLLKIGFTVRDVEERMKEHFPTKSPKNIKEYSLVYITDAIKRDGTSFKDHEVHTILKNNGYESAGGEWFKISTDELSSIIVSIKNNTIFEQNRNLDFQLRPEQLDAINKTKEYFKNFSHEKKMPHFLWNCKMRFGKTFTAYKLAESMKWKKIIILTFKPAVESAWKEDLLCHNDFRGWQFISSNNLNHDEIDNNQPLVCFGSFQDFLGKTNTGIIKSKNVWAHKIDWDCIILDEYHFGSWRESARELYNAEQESEFQDEIGNGAELWDEKTSPLKTKHFLYLSGTPFRAITSGEFIEEQIFNWTYTDEQKAKINWKGENNPYMTLPRMVIMTYKMPERFYKIFNTGEYNEFDLNIFFKAEGNISDAKFIYEDEVQKWLDLIRGEGIENIYSNLKLGRQKPKFPYMNSGLLNYLTHTFWFLPSVASCYAMFNLLKKRHNIFYHSYKVIIAAGHEAGMGINALKPVRDSMKNPLETKTITLSCMKLTTGVTVKPWSGLFMLRNTTSPETYFQTAFRVQSPWVIETESSKEAVNLKEQCYVFDFAPNRALKLITDYSCRLNVENMTTTERVEEFINFMPIICYDGVSFKKLNPEEVLDIGLTGSSGSQLARKFESPRLVNVDDQTLER